MLSTNGVSFAHPWGLVPGTCSQPTESQALEAPWSNLAQQNGREVMKPGVVKALLPFPTPGSSPCHNNEGPEPHTGVTELCGAVFRGTWGTQVPSLSPS